MRFFHFCRGTDLNATALLRSVVAASFLFLAPAFARADDAAPPAENIKAAAAHFRNAREMYQNGNYREAQSELEVALTLDPSAKDLVYNLGIVSEKLGRIDEAIQYFTRYVQLDVDASERARGEAFLKRLAGAKKEVPRIDDDSRHETPIEAHPPTPQKSNKKLTAVLVTGTVVAAAGVVVGTVFGAKAISDEPKRGTVTSATKPYSALANAASSAHNEAVVSDIGLGVGVVAAVATLILYLGTRPRAPIYLSQTTTPRVAPLVGNNVGGVALSGTF